jgi:hypothetical protein
MYVAYTTAAGTLWKKPPVVMLCREAPVSNCGNVSWGSSTTSLFGRHLSFGIEIPRHRLPIGELCSCWWMFTIHKQYQSVIQGWLAKHSIHWLIRLKPKLSIRIYCTQCAATYPYRIIQSCAINTITHQSATNGAACLWRAGVWCNVVSH